MVKKCVAKTYLAFNSGIDRQQEVGRRLVNAHDLATRKTLYAWRFQRKLKNHALHDKGLNSKTKILKIETVPVGEALRGLERHGALDGGGIDAIWTRLDDGTVHTDAPQKH